eukprot:5202715-Amphidinium_carterae.1
MPVGGGDPTVGVFARIGCVTLHSMIGVRDDGVPKHIADAWMKRQMKLALHNQSQSVCAAVNVSFYVSFCYGEPHDMQKTWPLTLKHSCEGHDDFESSLQGLKRTLKRLFWRSEQLERRKNTQPCVQCKDFKLAKMCAERFQSPLVRGLLCDARNT